MTSPKPGSSRTAISRTASGVTSRRATPVPPVVRMSWQPRATCSRTARWISLLVVRDERLGQHLPAVGLRCRFQRRAAEVIVEALRGAVRDGDDADLICMIVASDLASHGP